MKRLMTLSILVAIGTLSCYSTRPVSVSTPEELLSIESPATAEQRNVLASIIEDALAGTYRVDAETRMEAFRAIGRARVHDLLPAVRKVAWMKISDDPRRTLQDVVAVSGALDTLTDLADRHAVDANVRRLQDDRLRTRAIMNLLDLRAWQVTGRVEGFLQRAQPGEAGVFQVIAMLRFLDESPNTSAAICPALTAVIDRYSRCDVPAACAEAVERATSIRERCCHSGM